jgi:hypothetical protein
MFETAIVLLINDSQLKSLDHRRELINPGMRAAWGPQIYFVRPAYISCNTASQCMITNSYLI